jgi:hypothetical protein
LIDASEPRLAGEVLILYVPLVYFELVVGFHGGNLPPPAVALQVQQSISDGAWQNTGSLDSVSLHPGYSFLKIRMSFKNGWNDCNLK